MKCELCGRDGAVFSHAYECNLCADREECKAYHEAARDAQAAQDAADLEAGRALRRLVESGQRWGLQPGGQSWPIVLRVNGTTYLEPTLPAAVAAALGDVP